MYNFLETDLRALNAPISVNRGGDAGNGWGFDKVAKLLVNFPRVGQRTFIKVPTLGQSTTDKRQAMHIPLITCALNLV